MPHYVYILRSERLGKFYFGETQSIPQRLAYHNDPEANKIWSRRGIPWDFQVGFEVADKSEGRRLEGLLKKCRDRRMIERIITSGVLPRKWKVEFGLVRAVLGFVSSTKPG